MWRIKKIWNRFLANPKALFCFYIFVNLIPSLIQIGTEPYNLWGDVSLFIYPLGLYFILFTLSKNTGFVQLLLIPLLILHAFQIVISYLFGEDVIAVDMFLNVLTTNVTEAGELLGGLLPSIFFVCIVYIPAIIIAWKQCRRKVYLTRPFRRSVFFSGIGLLLLCYPLSFISVNYDSNSFNYHKDVYPVNVLYNLNFAANKWSRVNQYEDTSRDFTFHAKRSATAPQREVYVMVIGETGRTESWSLYGYERETTPRLQKDSNVVWFRDAITQSNTTHKSVSIMLSAASAEDYDIIYQQKSILTAFKECGFKTVFISNQSPNHTFTDFYSREADYTHFFRSMEGGENKLDCELLPVFTHYIDSVPENLFIVFHTYGSHFNYKERYPESFSHFKPDEVTSVSPKFRDVLVNAYDNSIRYTDCLLDSITNLLGEREICSAMLYSSDHGEDIMDDDRHRFLHASPHPTFYQLRIPLIMWFSDAYRHHFPAQYEAAAENKETGIATNSIFHTLLDMARITTNYLDVDLSLVNKELKAKKRMYLGDHDEPVPYLNAGLKLQDKEMIRKRKMSD